MTPLTINMSAPEFVQNLNNDLNEAANSGGTSGGGGEMSTISRTIELQMQMGKMDLGYPSRNTNTSTDYGFTRYCHTVLMLGIENCTLTGVTTESGEELTIFCYGGNGVYLDSVNNLAEIPNTACYVKFMLYKLAGFDSARLLSVTISGKPSFSKNDTPTKPEFLYFSYSTSYPSVAENANEDSNSSISSDYMGTYDSTPVNSEMICYDNGWVKLPPNYSRDGAPVPLAFYFHGTSGLNWSGDIGGKYGRITTFLANNGYATCGCFGMTNKHKNINDAFFAPSYVSSAASLIKYIEANYNVKTDGIYTFGKSAGGFMCLLIPQLQGFKVKAAAGLSSSTSSLVAMRQSGSYGGGAFAGVLWRQLGVQSTNDTHTKAEDEQLALNNVRLLRRYDPTFKSINLTDGEIQTLMNLLYTNRKNTLDELYAISDAQEIMDKAKIVVRCPIKIWSSIGDNSVPHSSPKWFVKLGKRGGSPFYLRKLPNSTNPTNLNPHNLVDLVDVEGSLITQYKTKYGGTVTETISVCEMVDWFNQW